MRWTDSFPAFARWRADTRHVAVVVFVVGLACLTPISARAQRIVGAVRDSGTNEPIRGAVLTISDSAGKLLARTLADTGGRFAMPRLSGAARLNAIRIGYRPRAIKLSANTNDSVVVRMESFISLMSAVSTTTPRVCPGDRANLDALELWEQARAGLLASVVARDQNPPHVRLYAYALQRNPTTRRIEADSDDVKDVVVQRSFVAARPAWVFAQSGYMQESVGGDRSYYAPDAETLLDPSFAETHCLRVVSDDKSHSREIGIGFEPVDGADRDTLVDVNGVLWLDADSPHIRSLEYKYTGLERDARNAGGEVYFFTTPGGVPMVDHWMIHTPILRYDSPSVSEVVHRQPPPRKERLDVRIIAYSETGGEVVSARWPDGTAWHGTHPRIVGTVKNARGEPQPNQRVWISGSKDTATTRADGSFELPYVLNGIFVVLASDSGLARHGLSRSPPIAVRLDSPADYRAQLVEYSRDDVLSLVCPAKSYRPGTGVLIGTIVDADGLPVSGAHVEALERPTVDTVRAFPRAGEAGPDGRFIICGASLNWPLRVRAQKDGAIAEARIENWSDDVVELRIVLRR